MIGDGADRRVSYADDGHTERIRVAGGAQRGQRERRRAARAHGDDGVLGSDPELPKLCASAICVVLRLLALRDEGDDLAEPRAEGRPDLGAVEGCEPAGGAGTHIDEAPTAGEAGGDRVDRLGQLVAGGGNGG